MDLKCESKTEVQFTLQMKSKMKKKFWIYTLQTKKYNIKVTK